MRPPNDARPQHLRRMDHGLRRYGRAGWPRGWPRGRGCNRVGVQDMTGPIKIGPLLPLSREPPSPIEELAADALVGYWIARGLRCEIQPKMAEFLIEVLRTKGFVISHISADQP